VYLLHTNLVLHNQISIDNLNFSFRHRLKKIFSIENHLQTVIKFAISPRLRPCIAAKLDVLPIEPSVEISKSFDISPTILRARLASCPELASVHVDDDLLDELCRKVLSNAETYSEYVVHGNRAETWGLYHAECNLLLSHLKNTSTTPFNYLGLSEPCRLACHHLFEAYRLSLQSQLQRGS
jgi:hypothetical protein